MSGKLRGDQCTETGCRSCNGAKHLLREYLRQENVPLLEPKLVRQSPEIVSHFLREDPVLLVKVTRVFAKNIHDRLQVRVNPVQISMAELANGVALLGRFLLPEFQYAAQTYFPDVHERQIDVDQDLTSAQGVPILVNDRVAEQFRETFIGIGLVRDPLLRISGARVGQDRQQTQSGGRD